MTFSSTFGRIFSPTFKPNSQASGGAFAPTSITGLKLWLDFSDAAALFTDAGTTKVSADAQVIYQVNDKSGNGFNAVQATAGSRPTYKTNIQNGLSVGRFDAGDKLLTASIQIVGAGGAWTFFACQKVTNVSNIRGVATQDSVAVRMAQFMRYAITTGYLQAITFNTVSASFTATYNSYLSGFAITSSRRTTTTIQAFGNGNAGTAVDTTGTPKAVSGVVGIGEARATDSPTDDPFLGDIGEIIAYNSALSNANMLSVETYLNNKWTIY